MRVIVTNVFSEKQLVFEGDRDAVHAQLLEKYGAFIAGPVTDLDDLDDSLEAFAAMQAFDVAVDVDNDRETR